MANPLAPRITSGGASFGLLVLRLVVGIALCFHGWGKVQHMTSWMPAGMTDGLPEFARAGWAQAFAAISEFGGGIALAAGVLTPLAALAVMGTMGMATYFHFSQSHPFVANGQGGSYELSLVFFAAALCILCCGPGKLSLDGMVFKKD